jgi:hypothetical protein
MKPEKFGKYMKWYYLMEKNELRPMLSLANDDD